MTHASAAYLSSVSFAAQADGWPAIQAEGWGESYVLYNNLVDQSACLNSNDIPWKQYTLSAAIEARSFDGLLNLSAERDRARLWAVGAPSAASWLTVTPAFGLKQVLSAREFSFLIRFWLGMDIYEPSSQCPLCNEGMDSKGYHALTCRTGGHLGIRHNALREEIFLACRVACLCPGRETPFLLSDSLERPADVFLPCFSLGQPACLDCAVTHPQQPIYVKDASLGKCAAANRYQCEVKEKMYAEKCKENDLGFYPMVVEVFGGWGSTAVTVFRHIAKMCASQNGESEGAAKSRLMQRLSFSLQRCNARTLLARLDPSAASLDDPMIAIAIGDPVVL